MKIEEVESSIQNAQKTSACGENGFPARKHNLSARTKLIFILYNLWLNEGTIPRDVTVNWRPITVSKLEI